MKPKEYYIFIDDKTGERYIVIKCSHSMIHNSYYRDMAITTANKVFKTKKSNLIIGPANWNKRKNSDKLTFWRTHSADMEFGIEVEDRIYSPKLMELNC